MIAAVLILITIITVFTMALCKAAGREDRWQEKQQEFDGYKYCSDDCYVCDYQKSCISSAMKYN